MGHKANYIGEFEELVLLAIAALGNDAYGVAIRDKLADKTGRDISLGSIYVTCDNLEAKGFVKSELGGQTAERGGRRKRFFQIQGAGIDALNQAEKQREGIRQEIPALLKPKFGFSFLPRLTGGAI